MYYILTDILYLHLLAFYDDELFSSYSQIAKDTGLTRQTVKTRMEKLKDNNLIVIEDGFVIVDNILDINVETLKKLLDCNKNQYYIAAYFYKQQYPHATLRDIAEGLKISHTVLYHYHLDKVDDWNIIEETNSTVKAIIYAIIQEGRIVYVGSTFSFEHRIMQHISKRPFLTKNDFILLEECCAKDRYKVERGYIYQFSPEWNIMSKEG